MMKNYSWLVVVASLVPASVMAGGFEKNVTWSGKYVALGGAAVSDVKGSESVYFNPAGMAAGPGHGDISLNFSPTFGHYEGPLVSSTVVEKSDKAFSPIGAGTVSYRVNEGFALGAGFYVSGGTKAIFDDVNLAAATGASNIRLSPRIQSVLTIAEFALGGAYEIAPGLRFGATWRILRVGGEFYTASASATPAANFTYVKIDDIQDTKYDGFKVGMQYEPESKSWGVGVSFRNNVNFDGEGKSSGQLALFAGGAPTSLAGGPTTISSSFPWQLSLGGNMAAADALRLHLELVQTNYAKVAMLNINGPISASRIPSVTTNWKDQLNIRLGAEYTGLEALALRCGYVYTSNVVPGNMAKATFSSPGTGHTVAVGAGSDFLADTVELNGALEYSFASGDGVAPAVPGKYKTSAYALHLGSTYRF